MPARLGLDAERDWAQLVGKSSCELVCAESAPSVTILDRLELPSPSESKGLSRPRSYPPPTLAGGGAGAKFSKDLRSPSMLPIVR